MTVARRLLPLALAAAGLAVPACTAPADGGGAVSSGPAAVVRSPQHPSGLKGNVMPRPLAMPDVTMTATDGTPFHLVADTQSPVTLLFFGYTHCPDVCNAVLADVATALRRSDPPVREAVRLVFVTTDPARDTPSVLRDYLDRFDPSFEGVTADLATIERAAAVLGVALEEPLEVPGGGYEVGHGTQLFGFEADDRARVQWSAGTPIGDLVGDFARLAERQG